MAATERSGQLELRHWHEVYLRDGVFDRTRVLGLMRDVLEDSRKRGFRLTRVTGHAEWAGKDWPGVEAFLEYECRLNDLLSHSRDTVICLYDLSKTPASLVIDVMRTHPMVIIGGTLQENPFFVPPDEFLRELRQRNGGDRRIPRA